MGTVPAPLPPLPSEDFECDQCGFVYGSVSVDAAIEIIRRVPGRVKNAVVGVSDEQLRARPSGTTWSALEYVCHVRDVYAVTTIRLYRTRVEDVPVLEPMLNDLRVVRFRYNERDVAAVVAEVG